MQTNDQTLQAKLREVFTNGVGEAGLEVGADPGLDPSLHVRVPYCLRKAYCARVHPSHLERYETVFSIQAPAAVGQATDDAGRQAAREAAVTDWDEGTGVAGKATAYGWIHDFALLVHDQDIYAATPSTAAGNRVELAEIHVVAPTLSDIAVFVQANLNHIGHADEAWTDEELAYVHGARFWAVVSGWVATHTVSEVVDIVQGSDPAASAAATDIARRIAVDQARCWTASVARVASWRKTNHATGGNPVSGFPLRHLEKEALVPRRPVDYATNAAARGRYNTAVTRATTMFYNATHATSAHAVLASMLPEVDDHFAYVNPSYGFIRTWTCHASARVRLEQPTQVAGVAVIADTRVGLDMLIKTQMAAFLTDIQQAGALQTAYDDVVASGMRGAVYARWFFAHHPTDTSTNVINQKDAAFASFAGEIAAAVCTYFSDSTLADSPALKNAVNQLCPPHARDQWLLLGNSKRQSRAANVVRAMAVLQGSAAGANVGGLASTDETLVRTTVATLNASMSTLCQAVSAPAPAVLNADEIVRNAQRVAAQTTSTGGPTGSGGTAGTSGAP